MEPAERHATAMSRAPTAGGPGELRPATAPPAAVADTTTTMSWPMGREVEDHAVAPVPVEEPEGPVLAVVEDRQAVAVPHRQFSLERDNPEAHVRQRHDGAQAVEFWTLAGKPELVSPAM